MENKKEFKYVGFWSRTLATIIDSIVISLVVQPIVYLLNGQVELALAFGFVAPIVITFLFWKYKSATPGKMAMGAKIVNATTGEAPSMMQYVIRYAGYFISAFVFCLGFIWVGFSKKKQGWHDLLANTVVVRR